MRKFYATLFFALMAMASFAQEKNDTTYVMLDFNQNPWNYPLTTTTKGWGPDYDDETGAIFKDTDFTWPVAEGSDKNIVVTVYAVDLDEYGKPAVYALVDNDTDGKTAGYTEEKIRILFTNPGTTMRFKAPEGFKFGKMVFYTFRSSNFLVGDDYEEEFEYTYDGNSFKQKLKVWTPDSPKKNAYEYDIWEGDETNILFNYIYFSAHFMKIDIRLVPDGTAGIQEIQVNGNHTGTAVGLDGRAVNTTNPSTLRKGVYIIDGKKYVVK